MNNLKIVSIIVPVYNVEKYLKRCISSLINQTFQDIEIILVNDGSTDSSLFICREFEKMDNRIKVINKSNGGLSEARNFGLNYAKGEYIYFIDSDDWCDITLIEKMYNSIISKNYEMCICNYYIEYTNNNYIIEKKLVTNNKLDYDCELSNIIYLLDMQGMFNVVWNKLYKRDIIINNNLQFDLDGMPGEDLLFNIDYFKRIKNITFINDLLYHYMREDETTLVSKFRPNLLLKVNKFNSERKKLYEHFSMKENKHNISYQKTYVGYMFSCIPNLYRKNALNFGERNHEINYLLKDRELLEYLETYDPQNLIDKIFKYSFSFNNVIVINLIFTILFVLKNHFSSLYRIFRKYNLKLNRRLYE